MVLMGFKNGVWSTAKLLITGEKPDTTHGLDGRTGKLANSKTKAQADMDDDLHVYFQELLEECDVAATRFVRLETDMIVERDNNNNKYLPVGQSMRYCFSRFCFKRGMYVYFDKNGNMKTVKRPNQPDLKRKWLLPFVGEHQKIPSWTKFRAFWNDNYGNIKLSKASEDICGCCYRFYNSHKYDSKPKSFFFPKDGGKLEGEGHKCGMANYTSKKTGAALDSAVCQVIESQSDEVDDEVDDTDMDTGMLFETDAENPDKHQETNERLTLIAAKHVTAARLQRKLVAKKTKAAVDYASGKSTKKVHTLVVDYCQNLQYPWYGAIQPGETYYFPHVNVYCLGMVDVADTTVEDDGTPGCKLHAHVYHEGEGDGSKGGDNVASLIMKQLEAFGWLEEIESGEAELNLVFDNCTGQNKNNMVLRLVPYLVENKFFTSVNCIFLVAGHTKNVADRMFNTLKHTFRVSQIWGMEVLCEVLESRTCAVHAYKQGDFKKYGSFLDNFYKKYSAIKKYHIFSCTKEDIKNNKVMVSLKEFDGDDALQKTENIVPTKGISFASRIQKMKDNPPAVIAESGLNVYKIVMLYKNHRPLLPQAWQDITAPVPTPQQLASVDKEKKIRNEKNLEIKDMKNKQRHNRMLDIN